MQQPGPAGGEVYLKATVAGDRVTATIPARLAATPKTTALARRYADDEYTDAERLILSLILGVQETQSDSGLFNFIYGATLDKGRVLQFTSTLYAAFQRLETWGFEWVGHRPIEVRLGSKNVYTSQCGGQIVPTLWDGPSTIRVDREIFRLDRVDLEAKAAHLVFHLIQSQYGPALDFEKPYDWLWMDEAAAVTLGATFGWRPSDMTYVSHPVAPDGLERSATSNDLWELYRHGGRAADFLIPLMERLEASDPIWLAKVYNRRKGASNPPAPVKAMQDVQINVGQEWLTYCRNKGAHLFVPEYQMYWNGDFSGGRSQKLEAALNKPVTFVWDAPDLSAEFFQVVPPASWPANAELYISASGATGVEVTLYRMAPNPHDSSGFSLYLNERGSSILITSPGGSFAPNDFLTLVVSNPRAVNPFTTTTPITITVVLRPPQATFLTSLRLANYVHVGIEVPVCSAGSPTCPKTLGITNWLEITPQAPNLPFTPANWTNTFSITGKASTAANDESVDISVEFDDTGNVLKRLVAAYSWTYREGSLHVTVHKMNFTVEGLPHTYPAAPGTSAYQKFSVAGASAAPYLKSYDWSVTVDDVVKGKVTSINWNGTGAPGIYVTFDKN